MGSFHFSFRAAASCLLVGVLSGVFPATAADGPPPASLKDGGLEPGAGGREKAALTRGAFSLSSVADRPWGTLPDSVYSRTLESGKPQPGTLLLARAFQDPAPQAAAQQAEGTAAKATPAKRHLPRWVWVAVIAGVAVGAGTAIVLANRQSERTSPPVTGVSVNIGGGSAGAP
jgi:hypothetical protein